MEILYTFLAILPAIFLAIWVWKILNWAWFKPRKLEKRLRDLGLRGTSYKFLFGDVKEILMMDKDAKSKPMSLFNNDIVPRISPFVNKTVKEHGENCYIWSGPTPAFLLMEPDLIKEVLNKSYSFLKPPGNPLVKLLAEGLASYEKEKWAKHRKLINPALQLERVKLMVPAFYASCCDMLSKWEEISGAKESFELDVWPFLQTLSSDAISRTAFGSNYEEGQRIFELQREQTALVLEVARSVYIPGSRFLPTRKNRRMREIARLVQSSVMEIINNRVRMVKSGEASNGDLLDILLESNSREIEAKGDKFGMSLHDVIEECKLFYFAGQETTSVLLVWTLILLSKHPDWQDRAREEVRQVIGDKSKAHFDDFNHLKVITMVINEVLRLYPPATMLSRMTQEDTKLGKLTLPSGVIILLPTVFLQHDTKIWGDDANEFKPERFSEGVLKATKGQLTYFPFGWGPRICPGQNFSMLESKMALAMMLQSYSFELSPSYTHAPLNVILLQPQHGAPLILRKL